MDSNHFKIAREAIESKRPVDGEVRESLSVLAERLAHTKELGGEFAKLGFSDEAERLARQRDAAAVC